MHNLNIGIVADWLVTYAGSEKVIKEFLEVFPESELYSIVDFLSDEDRVNFKERKQLLALYKNSLFLKLNTKSIYHSCH